MPKIVQYNLPPGGTVTQVADSIDPALLLEDTAGLDFLEIDTENERINLGGGGASVGIKQASPDAPLHVVGVGGDTGMAWATGDNSPTMIIENSSGSSKDRCLLALNADGASGSSIDLYQGDNRRMNLGGTSAGAYVYGDGVPVVISSAKAVEFGNGIRQTFAATNDFYQTGNEMRMDLSLGGSAIWVMDADIDEVKFGFYPGANQCATFTAIIQQNSSGGGSANSITWPTTATGYSASFSGTTYNSIPIYWAGGIKPVISTGANDLDVIQFLCTDEGGTRKVFASVVGQGFQQ